MEVWMGGHARRKSRRRRWRMMKWMALWWVWALAGSLESESGAALATAWVKIPESYIEWCEMDKRG